MGHYLDFLPERAVRKRENNDIPVACKRMASAERGNQSQHARRYTYAKFVKESMGASSAVRTRPHRQSVGIESEGEAVS